MNYFELYSLPVSFIIDKDEVKKKFLELSRKHHPDFFANELQQEQDAALQFSTLNTKAFETLSDFDKRMKYVLELKNKIQEGERYELPPHFLMEMMNINEALMELKMNPGEKEITDCKSSVAEWFKRLDDEMKNVIDNYSDEKATDDELEKIKSYYFRKKYLLRIRESLDSFAAL